MLLWYYRLRFMRKCYVYGDFFRFYFLIMLIRDQRDEAATDECFSLVLIMQPAYVTQQSPR